MKIIEDRGIAPSLIVFLIANTAHRYEPRSIQPGELSVDGAGAAVR